MGSKIIKNSIGIIPARGGSKNIKNKNLTKVNGQTLVEIAYNKAKSSKKFDKIICSTDSIKIIELCKKKKIPYIKRPKKLSMDNSNVIDAVIHVLNNEKRKNINYKIVGLLQPTSPFLKINHIKKVINKLQKNNLLNSCQTIHKTPHNYHFLNSRLIKSNFLKFRFEKERLKKFNKQKKIKIFSFGNFLACRVKNLIKTKNLFVKPAGYVLIDRISSFDLDDQSDIIYLKVIQKFFSNDTN